MTIKPVTTEIVVVEPPPIEPVFDVYGFPVFIIKDNNDIGRVKDLNLDFAFLIVSHKFKDGKETKTVPTMMKMINTSFGYSIVNVNYKDLGIKGEVETQATLKLPKIPWQMMHRLDKFLHEAFDKYGTEATAILLYDMDKIGWKNNVTGWEYFVPEQKNNDVACKYDKTAHLTYIQDTNKQYVGTVHSHPEMNAYMSHTDDGDQYDMDGLHLTRGWPKGGAGSWFGEMICGGVSWSITPEQIFESPPTPNFQYTNLDSDLNKVSKAVPPQVVRPAWGSGTTPGGYDKSLNPHNHFRPNPNDITHTGPIVKPPKIFFPSTVPDPTQNTIIAVLTDNETKCRFCNGPLTAPTREACRCYACASFFIGPDAKWEDINGIRQALKLPYSSVIDPQHARNNIWLWIKKEVDNKVEDDFVLVHTTNETIDAKK